MAKKTSDQVNKLRSQLEESLPSAENEVLDAAIRFASKETNTDEDPDTNHLLTAVSNLLGIRGALAAFEKQKPKSEPAVAK
jgi:hypothetical protein